MKRRTFISMMSVMAAAGVLTLSGCSNSSTSTAASTGASSAAGSAADQLAAIQASGKLIVALEGAWQPWSYHDESDTLVGYDVEVSRAIAEKLGVEPEYVESDWDSLFAGLDAGRFDMVCNGVEVTDERALTYDFTTPYGYIHTALAVRKDNDEIKTFEDLKGKTVAVSSGTSSEIILEQALARAGMTMDDINTVEMTVDGMTTAMISGQIDAAASWSPNTVTLQNALGDNYVDLGTNADFLDSAIFPSSYICTPEYAEANHDILVRFAQALDKAHDWRAAHPEEMAKLLAKELDAPEDTMLAAVGEADWQTITEVCGDMDAIKTVYETQQGIFLDNGTITENVPVEDYVLFDVMQEAYDAYSAAK